MSSDNGNYIVGIEMDDMEKEDKTTDLDYQPVEEEEKAAGSSFKARFKSILTDYHDETTWWAAVAELVKKDGGFAEKVTSYVPTCMELDWHLITLMDHCRFPRSCRLKMRYRMRLQKERNRGSRPLLK